MLKSHRPSKRSKEKFEFFSQCSDSLRLPKTEMCRSGASALVCFHVKETHGKTLPCCEPELFMRALNGKEQHGITVTMVAEDYLDRLTFAREVKNNYPAWVANEIFARAKQLSTDRIGFTPTFVSSVRDFSTIK